MRLPDLLDRIAFALRVDEGRDVAAFRAAPPSFEKTISMHGIDVTPRRSYDRLETVALAPGPG
jgi:hypothetical protein